MDQYIKNKIRRTKPRVLEIVTEDPDPVRVDMGSTSTQAAHATIDALDWEQIRALDEKGNVLWILNREDVPDSESDSESDWESEKSPAKSTENQNPYPVGTPEAWLSVLIRAQESATRAQNEAMTILVDALQTSHQRSQELLDRAHETILSQREQIDRLLEEKAPGVDVEKLVEQLAPIVAPLLLQQGAKK